MNIRQIVEQIDSLVNVIAPFAGIVGLDKYAVLAQVGVDIIEKLVDNVDNTTEVLSSEDEAFIRSKIVDLQIVNDALAKRVEDS